MKTMKERSYFVRIAALQLLTFLIPIGAMAQNLSDMPTTPLTFVAVEAGAKVSCTYSAGHTGMYMEYKKNDGSWTNYTTDNNIELTNIGDVVAFRCNGYGLLPSFKFSCTKKTKIYGNVMSLVIKSDFQNQTNVCKLEQLFYQNTNIDIAQDASGNPLFLLPATTLSSGCYNSMFNGCTGLTIAPALPAMDLESYGSSCYESMFRGCTSLTTPPDLPATSLAQTCYKGMFSGCTSLKTAPALPATTMKEGCYENMFYGCTSLTKTPDLRATNLAKSCYKSMFGNCEYLKTVSALPATTLKEACYYSMFLSCANLEETPVLPATTLQKDCYRSMFANCAGLKKVVCLATDHSATTCTDAWFNGAPTTGITFVKPSSTSWPSGGDDGIPSGWTVVNISATKAVNLNNSTNPDLSSYANSTCYISCNRTSLTSGQSATVCFPFNYTPQSGEGTYSTFTGVAKNSDGKWVATMTEHTGALVANTPYVFTPASDGSIDYSGTYTLPSTVAAASTTSGDWKFCGTYEPIVWNTGHADLGKIYGFAAEARTGIEIGQFVKAAAGASIAPGRTYLKYAPSLVRTRGLSEETDLPRSITVVLVKANGDTTEIGTISVSTEDNVWYTLDGIKLNGTPSVKGLYIHNGKKEIIR
jgi:hypothetical protein